MFDSLTDLLIKLGFLTSCLINSFLIYLTVVHVTYIKGAYKYMIIIFAASCIFFDATEVLAQPYLHNFNGSLMYLSLNRVESPFLITFYQWFIDFYAGLYASLIGFVAVQFIFRCATLMGHRGILRTFKGWKGLTWMFAMVVPGCLFCGLGMILMQPDEYSDEYVRKEIEKVYKRRVEDVPRLILVAYDSSNNVRWKNFSFSLAGTCLVSLEYLVIIFCTIKMQLNITESLKNVSLRHRNLERQFFKAILVQISLPTFFLTLPILPMLMVPILNTEISFHSSVFYTALGWYPAMDSVAMIFIVSEYRNVVKKLLKSCFPDTKKATNEISLSTIPS